MYYPAEKCGEAGLPGIRRYIGHSCEPGPIGAGGETIVSTLPYVRAHGGG